MREVGTKRLETERLVLRRFTKQDAKEIFEGFVNQKEFLYYTNKKPVTLEEEIQSLENINEKYENKNYYNWIIALKNSQKITATSKLSIISALLLARAKSSDFLARTVPEKRHVFIALPV